ncbi:hypothetical protein ACTA71_007466 [Dictyostelium dimigraforme]
MSLSPLTNESVGKSIIPVFIVNPTASGYSFVSRFPSTSQTADDIKIITPISLKLIHSNQILGLRRGSGREIISLSFTKDHSTATQSNQPLPQTIIEPVLGLDILAKEKKKETKIDSIDITF